MNSLDRPGATTQTEPETAERSVRRAPPEPEAKRDDRPHTRRAAPRCSPDPFVATDRYRLTMPYADRI